MENLPAECQLINMANDKGMIELENYHLAISILISASSKNHQWRLKLVGEVCSGTWYSHSLKLSP